MPRITHRKLFPPIVDCHAAQAGWHSRLLDRLIESPDLQYGLAAEILLLNITSQPVDFPRGVYKPYPNCDQQARSLDLAHVRDADILVCLEAADDPPAGAHDAHMAVRAAEEEAVGAGADAGDLVAVEEGARLVVVGELNLADIEEVEGFPLRRRASGISV